MIKELIKLADHLDKKGLHREANYVDALLKRANAPEAGTVQMVGQPKVQKHTRQDGSLGAYAFVNITIPFRPNSPDGKSLDGQLITATRSQNFDYPVGHGIARNRDSARDMFSEQLAKVVNALQAATGMQAANPTMRLKYIGPAGQKQLARAYDRAGKMYEVENMTLHTYEAKLGIAGGTQ